MLDKEKWQSVNEWLPARNQLLEPISNILLKKLIYIRFTLSKQKKHINIKKLIIIHEINLITFELCMIEKK